MKIRPSDRTSASRQGFTLVEVLVGSFITAILLLLLFRVVTGAMSAWQNGSARMQTNADARLALDLIARDLQSFVARQTSASVNQEWLYAAPEDVAVNVQDGISATVPMSTLLFLAPSIDRDSNQEGDIVAIRYQVAFQDPLAPNPDNSPYKVFGLYKTMIDTTNTFLHVLGQDDIRNFWTSPALNPPDPGDFVIGNVLDFSMSFWIRDLTNTNMNSNLYRIPVYAPWEPTAGNQRRTVRLRNVLEINGMNPPWKIESAEISLTMLDNQGAQRIRLVKNTDQLKDIRREFGRVYTQRVKINY
jgi:prepilin-type N-terminal cleavage/methylation domain-containing protein